MAKIVMILLSAFVLLSGALIVNWQIEKRRIDRVCLTIGREIIDYFNNNGVPPELEKLNGIKHKAFDQRGIGEKAAEYTFGIGRAGPGSRVVSIELSKNLPNGSLGDPLLFWRVGQ